MNCGKAGAGMADSGVDAAGAGVGATVLEATGSFSLLIACSFLNKLDASGILSTEAVPAFCRVIEIYPHMI
jgi:hypothetical protein